ncbi:hypothetical protein DNC80_07715 [Flavobacterium sp. SOK18b]|uniref:hypothetical protein n=1 Tax=Flavobacterium sp. SOK18b TaxID=797900 RepID=UPI0015F8A95F|nr:hypothetical protein [Flavobacterium sp. SOK18b]MBB1193555.1 hypothetical protein [Flavobacterium sp. SOK18b]
MSNIANIHSFLKGNPKRFINITNQETGESITPEKEIYLKDIENEDIENFIKNNLGAITKPVLVWIEMRTQYGSSSKKEGHCKIEVSPNNYQPNQSQNYPDTNMQPVVTPNIIPQYNNPPSFLGSPGPQNFFGLGFAEVLGMQSKADLLKIKEEQYSDLKDEYKELKNTHNLLVSDHRDALTKLSIAEGQKELAVQFVRSENKSAFDSPAFQTLMDKAPELISSFVAMKTGALPQTAGVLGSPDMSETHRQFLEFVSENLNDQQVNFLGSVCHFINNESFVSQLKILIQNQNGSI